MTSRPAGTRREMTSAPTIIPIVHELSTRPKAASPTPRTSSAKNTSAGIEADMKRSETKATLIASASTGSRNKLDDAAAGKRLAFVLVAFRVPPRPQRDRGERDDDEARGVDEHRGREPSRRAEQPADGRTDDEAGIARRLDVAVRLPDVGAARDRRRRARTRTPARSRSRRRAPR